MSWKSLVCAGLVCVLASPAIAAPGLSITNGGLNAQGDWIWNVSLDPQDSLFHNPPDNPDQGLGGSMAAELGFTAGGSSLLSATKNATNFPNDNPGNSPFAAPINGEQTGVVTSGNNAFAGLGSIFFTTGTAKPMLTIITDGPSTTGSLSSSITVSGAYGGMGRIAQMAQNFDVYSGMASRTAKAADANLDGTVNLLDLAALGAGWNTAGTWSQGNFNGQGNVDLLDLAILGQNWQQSGGSNTPLNITAMAGSGAGAAVGVPEPASIALAGLGLLALAGLARRR